MKTIHIALFFLVISISYPLQGDVVGSDDQVARQSRTFFRKATSLLNKMKGFSVFQKGFVLEGPGTDVSFDAFFPIYGDVVLNGGKLELKGDLAFRNPFQIGVGTIKGNSFALEFPRNIPYLDFPSLYYLKLIVNLVDQIDVGYDVYSLDWGYDDNHIAVGVRGKGGNSELRILSFDGSSLLSVTSEDFGNNSLNSVRWSPSSDYLVTGASGGTELKSWLFTQTNSSIQEIDSEDIGAVNAVAWRPDNAYVAVGSKNSSSLRVYPVTNGFFGPVITGPLGANVTVRNNALGWHSSGSHIAVGFQKSSSQAELKIFSFNGSTLTAAGEKELGTHLNAVAWRPNSTFLAVGLASGSERLRLYSYDTSSELLTELTSAYVGLSTRVYGVAWDVNGNYLAVAKSYAAQGYELEVYYFNSTDNTLHLVSGYNSDALSRAVGWAHSGNYLSNGDDSDNCLVYNFVDQPFVFEDLKLYFGSEIRAHSAIQFKGDCVINGNGNILQLTPTTSLIVTPAATLTLEDITIKGIIGDNIHCMDESSKIILRDVQWVQDGDFTFTIGAFQFKNIVNMQGEAQFNYESLQTSTIITKSTLQLDPLFTFSYSVADNSTDSLLAFEDSSSTLILNGATIATNHAGLSLKKGKMIILRDSFFSSDGTNGIIIGNNNASDDFRCDILSGSVLHMLQGTLNYRNILSQSWQMISDRAWLKLMNNTTLNLYENLDLGLGVLWFAGNATLARADNKTTIGRIHVQGEVTIENL